MLKLTKSNTISRPVTIRLPTDNTTSFNEGTLQVRFNVLTKDELTSLGEQNHSDRQYIDRVVADVIGLGDENGNAISGDAAIKEVNEGHWSAYLQAAILGDFFEQFGDARVKNSKPSRGR